MSTPSDKNARHCTAIKVIALDSAGYHAVNTMMENRADVIEFICITNDERAPNTVTANTIQQPGSIITGGLDTGSGKDIDREATLENRDILVDALRGADMVFVIAGIGDNRVTGTAPIIAEITRELGILTIAVVSQLPSFEGKNSASVAGQEARELVERVDTLITIPGKLITTPGNKLDDEIKSSSSSPKAYNIMNDAITRAIFGITDFLTRPGVFSVDSYDIEVLFKGMGNAAVGVGVDSGEGRAYSAVMEALNTPQLDNIDLKSAKGVLINITDGPESLTVSEFSEIEHCIRKVVNDHALLLAGTFTDDDMENSLRVTVIVVGAETKPSLPPSDRHWSGYRADSQAQGMG